MRVLMPQKSKRMTLKRYRLLYRKPWERDEFIRVGPGYQAVLPEVQERPAYQDELNNDRSTLVWTPPTYDLLDEKFMLYMLEAQYVFSYTIEQALSLLFSHNYDMDKAFEDLKNVEPATISPMEWKLEEMAEFEAAFAKVGKNFNRIKKLMPHTGMRHLMFYYYLWKIKQNSFLFKPHSLLEYPSNDVSDVRRSTDGDKMWTASSEEKLSEGVCGVMCCVLCRVSVTLLQSTYKGTVCSACYSLMVQEYLSCNNCYISD